MAPPNANMGDDDDETQTLNASFEQQTKAQGGEIYGGSSGRPWSIYLTETEKQDKEMIERWKGEADTALIFAGLFTAVVTVSLVESYKWLSPDRGDETIKLLAQISGQLANISSLVSNGIPLESISAESRQPFKPTASTVLVNLAWFGSLVLCLACSVGATLIQLCARRYLALTQGRGAPYERAHLRTFMFDGVRRFEVDRILQVVPILLQLSVLLYCLGLLIFLFSIGPRIGFAALVILIIFNLIYAIFTVLPIFSLNSPYATPYSPLTWRLFHVFLLGVFSTIRGIVNLFHGPLSTLWSRTYRPVGGPHEPAQWRKMLERRVKTHRRKFSDGIWKSIEHRATDASQMVDANTLEWTLTARVENSSDKEIEDFAAWVPEFFDTYARSAASEAIHPLMSDKPPTHPIFGFRLHHLLKTCMLETSDLTEEERKRRLRVCLKCLWYWVEAYDHCSAALPSYFPLPDPDMTGRLQIEQDPTARMIGRCLGALVAKKLAADVTSRHSSDVRVREAKLASLSAILESTGTEVEKFLSQPGAIGLANMVALTSSEMNTLVTEMVPSELLYIFQKTVYILAKDFLTSLDVELPLKLVATFHGTYFDAQRLQAPGWLVEQLGQISETLYMVSDARQAGGIP